jgi:hypothetical protein
MWRQNRNPNPDFTHGLMSTTLFPINLTCRRWVRFLFALLVFFSGWSVVGAQFKGRPTTARQTPAAISESDGELLIQRFQQNQNIGAFGYRFHLEERPYRSPSLSVTGRLFGYWLQGQRWSRIELDGSEHSGEISYIMDGSLQPRIWKRADGSFSAIPIEDMNNPLVPGFSITLFEILMPYLHWEESDYQGPTRIMGRPVHRFVLENPEQDIGPAYVELSIDESYAVMLQLRSYNSDDTERRRWQAAQFKRIGEDWTIGRIDVSDPSSRGRSRLAFTHWCDPSKVSADWLNPESAQPFVGNDIRWTEL